MKRPGAPSFADKCYELLKQVPHGKVTTYKALAQALNTRAFRAVGQAMHRNPNAPKVPCHRVVRSNGEVGGYAHGTQKKVALLRAEGITIKGGKILGLENCLANLLRADKKI